MTEDKELNHTAGRVMRSARVLKAYFEHKLNLTLELLTEAPPEPLAEGMQFDLQINDWGIWGLRSSENLSEKVQAEISASFHGLLGAVDSQEKRQHDLRRMEQKYQEAIANLPSNVIPLRRARDARPIAFTPTRDKRWLLKQDCLIESPIVMDIHKMALELHFHSRRLAFIDYRDLGTSMRLNLSELIQFGQITLFVPNILELTMEEQEILNQLTRTNILSRPLLMVGANMAYSDLRTEPKINLLFLLQMSRAYIKLTRPFAHYRDQGLIHYFLDTLAQAPT